MAHCRWCNVFASLRRCRLCNNVWHCNRKPGREGMSINVCDECRSVDKFETVR